MKRIDVRDKNNITIGYTTESDATIQAIHLKKGYVGQYFKNSDLTVDRFGKTYCRGDGTQSLIRDVEREMRG